MHMWAISQAKHGSCTAAGLYQVSNAEELMDCRNTLQAMELIDGAADAILRLKLAGHRILVVSSQSCIGYGYVTEPVVDAVMDRVCSSSMYILLSSPVTLSAVSWHLRTWHPIVRLVLTWPLLIRIRGSAMSCSHPTRNNCATSVVL